MGKITGRQRTEVAELYRSGEKVSAIAARFGISPNSVTDIASSYGVQTRKVGRPENPEKAGVKTAILGYMKGKGVVPRDVIWTLMGDIKGERSRWELLSEMRADGSLVSVGGGKYRAAGENVMSNVVLIKKNVEVDKTDIADAIISSLLSGREFGDAVNDAVNEICILMGAGSMGGAPATVTETIVEAEKSKDRKEVEKAAADAVKRIRKIQDTGNPDPTNGGFFI